MVKLTRNALNKCIQFPIHTHAHAHVRVHTKTQPLASSIILWRASIISGGLWDYVVEEERIQFFWFCLLLSNHRRGCGRRMWKEVGRMGGWGNMTYV